MEKKTAERQSFSYLLCMFSHGLQQFYLNKKSKPVKACFF